MIHLTGIGPGERSVMTDRVLKVLEGVDCVVGYERYTELVRPVLGQPGPELEPFPIGREVRRAEHTIERARTGEDVALISSGDAGIYGMGAALFEVLEREDVREINVTVHPGVSSLNASASLLGAPLGQDFASISLSDHLTPWSRIQHRVEHAGEADFVVVFFNPRSSRRPDQLGEALKILRKYRNSETPVGIVRSAYRRGEETSLETLETVDPGDVDMLTTVVVGNSRTRVFDGWMYTPRGYTEAVSKT